MFLIRVFYFAISCGENPMLSHVKSLVLIIDVIHASVQLVAVAVLQTFVSSLGPLFCLYKMPSHLLKKKKRSLKDMTVMKAHTNVG